MLPQLLKPLLISCCLLFSLQGYSLKHREGSAVIPGACRMNEYLPMLNGKRVAFAGNHTSRIGMAHLVDTLLTRNINIVKIFGPEHGFRGNAADGTFLGDDKDPITGIPIVSLYGSRKKPLPADMEGFDILLFDIQDVGCRFYTYISTMSYLMEACAEKDIPMVILDRPNPNGYYVDGPVLQSEFASFVGLHPVPVVYGMTIGEYALMVNGEKWLKGGIHCKLIVIECRRYTHSTRYSLPVPPSPNLPTMNAVYLYPSLCLFEGTVVSVGRGTDHPFEVYGHPGLVTNSYMFTPESRPGISDHPPLEGEQCLGQYLGGTAVDLKNHGRIELFWLLSSYKLLSVNNYQFFTDYFDKLAGSDLLRKQIIQGMNQQSMRDSWQKDIQQFMKIRNKYLLYPDNQ